MSDTNYYEVLGLGPEAESDEIERAYRRALAKLRQDEPGDDGARARLLGQARAVLVDVGARAEYDARCVGQELIDETVTAILETYRRKKK